MFLVLLGLLLRIFFVHRHAFLAGDSILYQEIAQNWVHEGVYGLSTETTPRPTMIRLPGYPLVLAALGLLFDPLLKADPGTLRSFLPVLYLQVAVDLMTCGLSAWVARRLFGQRAGWAALVLACLCPFTANYTAVPLTETFTLFTTVAAYWFLLRRMERRGGKDLLGLCAMLSFSILLRPDQGLLAAAVLPFLWNGEAKSLPGRARPVVLAALLVAMPFVPWTLRNLHTFGVFQPLAPRLANDPGDAVPRGFQRWYRTFGIDFSTTQDAYWKYPEEPVKPDDLPARAFDSPAQREETRELLHEAAAFTQSNARLDAQFATLAAERIGAHPVRYYVLLPMARLADMLLHPRVEMLPVDDRWWKYRAHPGQTIFACAYAALNLGYIVLALTGMRLARRRRSMSVSSGIIVSMCVYLLLRCALLLMLDNAEQRYTLEFFPVLIVLGSACFARSGSQQAEAR